MEFFVYGTLTDSARCDQLLPTWTDHGPAVLDGLHRIEGRYPTLVGGGTTDGRLISTPAVEALDEYEAVDSGLYVRVTASVVAGDTVELYVGDPGRLGVEYRWPGAGRLTRRVQQYVDRAVVVKPRA